MSITFFSSGGIIVASAATVDMNQRLVQAGMGNIKNITTVKCDETQMSQLSSIENKNVNAEECAKQLTVAVVNKDGKAAVNSIVSILVNAGVVINERNMNFYQCHVNGSLWGTHLITDLASMHLLLINPPTAKTVESDINVINNNCDPQMAKSFMKIIGTLHQLLINVQADRYKEALRIQNNSIAIIQSEETRQHELEVQQEKHKRLLEQKRKVQNANIEAAQQEQAQANQKRREEYIASIKSGQSPIRTVRDGAIMMDAEDASMMVYQPVVAATGRAYSGFGVLQSWNNNFMVLNLGKKHIDLLVTGETKFMNESHDRLRLGGTIFYVGKYLGAPNGDASFSINYISDHQ